MLVGGHVSQQAYILLQQLCMSVLMGGVGGAGAVDLALLVWQVVYVCMSAGETPARTWSQRKRHTNIGESKRALARS